MKKITFLLSLLLLLDSPPSLAQQGLFGSCSQEKVIKFIDVGLSKDEIVQLCRSVNTGTEKPTSRAIAKVKRNSRGDLKALNGKWAMDADCPPHSAYATDIVVNNGKFSSILDGGDDTLNVIGTIDKNGRIDAYGTGTYVLGEITGRVTDWRRGKGKGAIIVGGEMDCEGTFIFNKKRRR